MQSDDKRDSLDEQIVTELQRAAKVDHAAIARLMAAVEAPPRAGRFGRATEWMVRPQALRLRPVIGLAAAAILAVALLRFGPPRHPIENSASVDTVRSVEFIVVADSAARVNLVGDFNDWDAAATPLIRKSEHGVWSVVVPLAPGRHLYSYVVDGHTWIPDAVAPRAPDHDFGGARSVILVRNGS